MTLYLIYDEITGQPKQTVTSSAPPEDLGGVLLLEGPVDLDRVRVVSGVLQAYDPPVDMDKEKRLAKDKIDNKASKLRSLVGSHGYGQEMMYIAKKIEAAKILADPAPDPANYPLAANEVGIHGATVTEVAQEWETQAFAWETIGGSIEGVRLGTKQQINAATTKEQVWDLVNQAVWPDLGV